MNLLKTYSDKPFICLMKSGMAYYLNQEQYTIVAQAWASRSLCQLKDYYDPAMRTWRDLPIDGFHIETVDQSDYVQQQHWLKQGGFVCAFKTFHNKGDSCNCAPKEKMPEAMMQPSIFAQALLSDDVEKLSKLSEAARVSLVAGWLFGRVRGFKQTMEAVSTRVQQRGIESMIGFTDFEKIWIEKFKLYRKGDPHTFWIDDAMKINGLPSVVEKLRVDKNKVCDRLNQKDFKDMDPDAAWRAQTFVIEVWDKQPAKV